MLGCFEGMNLRHSELRHRTSKIARKQGLDRLKRFAAVLRAEVQVSSSRFICCCCVE
jgi:hypothetical protein